MSSASGDESEITLNEPGKMAKYINEIRADRFVILPRVLADVRSHEAVTKDSNIPGGSAEAHGPPLNEWRLAHACNV